MLAVNKYAKNFIGSPELSPSRPVVDRTVIIHIVPDYSARPVVYNIHFVSTTGDPETAQIVTKTVTTAQSSNWARAFNKFGFASDLRGGYKTTEPRFDAMCKNLGISNPLAE